jgi:sulfate adenylyltransferase
MIEPHGGRLVDLHVDPGSLPADIPSVNLDSREASDLEMMGCGALSPLTGFMCSDDYESVLERMRLAGGLVFSLPVTLSKKAGDPEVLPGDVAALRHNGALLGHIRVREVFKRNNLLEAEKTLLTSDHAHPGAEYLRGLSDTCIGGDVECLDLRDSRPFREYRLTPAQTRALFREKGWKTVVAFQTRNPIHRAHEYLQKCALEIVDGLLVHPLVGDTKEGDIPAETRMRCYTSLLDGYFPAKRVALSVFPAAMRYAGPREAVFHAIARKNYGCTHFIVGRDHAGVGNYYGTYDAQAIFDRFDPSEIGITPLKFEHSFFCRTCGNMATSRTCPHDSSHHVFLSGTRVREMLACGELPPAEFTRPEVARILMGTD